LEKEKISVMSEKKRPWDLFKESLVRSFVDKEHKDYINSPGYLVPENTIAVVLEDEDVKYKKIAKSLIGHPSREWMPKYASFCLPVTMANQYGFVIESQHDVDVFWDGESNHISIKILDDNQNTGQAFTNEFGPGILTINNAFVLRTPPDVNIITMQPPNYFIPGLHVASGVVESDNLRRNFTFNLIITNPNKTIHIKKGDWLSGFMPIPRFYVENFELKEASKIFDGQIIENERDNIRSLSWERTNHKDLGGDIGKTNDSGRRYFKGIHVNESKYRNHQKRITDTKEV
jgi:hypothetical protein